MYIVLGCVIAEVVFDFCQCFRGGIVLLACVLYQFPAGFFLGVRQIQLLQ
jgi:hypothetical protein